jgi:2-dehydropantoate 2-reductase
MGATDTPLALVGAGALGQAFAGLLAANGQTVTLLATPRTAAQLIEAGQIRLRGTVELDSAVAQAPAPSGVVGVTTDPTHLPAHAGLIFATKGHHLPEAIDAVRAAWPAPADQLAWVAGIQNGIVKDDLLAAAFGAERVVGGATILAGQRHTDGTVTVATRGMTYLGELAGGLSPRTTAAAAALQAAGIPTTVPDDIRSVLWSKACNAAGVFGVSALTRVPASAVFQVRELLIAYLGLIRETAAIGAAEGALVGDYPGFPPIKTYVESPDDETIAKLVPPPGTPRTVGGSWPSMTQDLLAGRPFEAEAIFGDFVARGERAGLPVTRLTLVRDLLCGLYAYQIAG